MTPIRKAKEALDKMIQARNASPIDEGLRFIEQAITAAVEETRAEMAHENLIENDRALTAAIEAAKEEEREAVLSVIAKQRQEYKQLATQWAEESSQQNANPVAKLYAHSMTVCEILERQIRARSEDAKKK